MKGDFSRSSFNALKHYRGVRLQQGRVQLDADWNEQVDIQLHQTECELCDLLGAYAAPQANAGFAITLPATLPTPDPSGQLLPPDVQIAQGQRYVDGILCSSESKHSFSTQPDFPGANDHRQAQSGYQRQLVYLDVWQHHVTAREDSDLREVALDGLDTTTRIKTVAQVKFWPAPADSDQSGNAQVGATPTLSAAFTAFLATQPKLIGTPKIGMLEAQKTNEGTIPQNQLYRVEIHRAENGQVNFKWSRENGAVAYSILEIKANDEDPAHVDTYLKDVKAEQLDLQNKGWVEITSNNAGLDGKAGVFGTVIDIRPDIQRITVEPVTLLLFSVDAKLAQELNKGQLSEALRSEFQSHQQPLSANANITVVSGAKKWVVDDSGPDFSRQYVIRAGSQALDVYVVERIALADKTQCDQAHMLLQRWDQKESKDQSLDHGTVIVKTFDTWMTLENGIQVKFISGVYTIGDYWLIPARVNLTGGTGGILWPQQDPSQPPTGIVHHYAPLALLQYTAGAWQITDQDKSTFRTLPVLSDDVDELATRMTNAEGKIVQLQGAVRDLETAVQKLDGRVTALEGRMDKVEERLDALQHIQLYQNFHADEELAVGMVVACSSTKHDHVEKANATNASLLVGVVIEEHRKALYRVAMQGRTQCKAVGALKPGALLIPSSKEAGSVEPAGLYLQPGTVLGKVLHVPESYTNGTTDMVDVLITLS